MVLLPKRLLNSKGFALTRYINGLPEQGNNSGRRMLNYKGMSDRTKKLRKTAFETSLPDPPTDSIVASYFSRPSKYSEEEQKQMYVRYVEKVFRKLHPRKIVH